MNLMTRFSAAALSVLFLALEAPAAEGVRDLGHGLSYYRIHSLPEDLPTPPSGRPGACVLDLRFAKADLETAAALKAWVRFNATARSPIFVLENAATALPLKRVLRGNRSGGIIVLAPADADLTPDITVTVAPDDDRSAYEAVEKGAPVETLLQDYPDKPRIDEAYLEKEHIPDSDAPDLPDEKDLPARPKVDRLLQRAVQLHRGLLALKRIQG